MVFKKLVIVVALALALAGCGPSTSDMQEILVAEINEVLVQNGDVLRTAESISLKDRGDGRWDGVVTFRWLNGLTTHSNVVVEIMDDDTITWEIQ